MFSLHGSKGHFFFDEAVKQLLQHFRDVDDCGCRNLQVCLPEVFCDPPTPPLFLLQAEPAQEQQMTACCSCALLACKRTSGLAEHCFGMQTCNSLGPISLVPVLPQLPKGLQGLPCCDCELPL